MVNSIASVPVTPTVSPNQRDAQRLESPSTPVSAAGGSATPPAIIPQVVQVQVATDMLRFANQQPAELVGALVNVQA